MKATKLEAAAVAVTALFILAAAGYTLGGRPDGDFSVSAQREPERESVLLGGDGVSAHDVLELLAGEELGGDETGGEQLSWPLDINEADEAALAELPGIGEVIAGRIVKYRDEHGSFKSLEELFEVEGIGEKRFEDIKDLITLGESG